MINHHIEKLQKIFPDYKIDTFLITSSSDLRYLFGFTGTAGLGLVTSKKAYFITDFRYKDQSAKEVHADEIILADIDQYTSLKSLLGRESIKNIGFESGYLTYKEYSEVKNCLKNTKMIPCEDVIEQISAVKTESEIGDISKAAEITLKVFEQVKELFVENVTEKEIAAEISFRIKKEGGDRDAFPPIVLFGKNTAMPHGQPSGYMLQEGDLIQLDFGAVYNGYNSDFSRVLALGKIDRQKREIYLAVKSAIDRTIESIKPGMKAMEVDSIARKVIAKRGFDRYFGHSTGHGVGINIHALPKISMTNNYILKPGNVITIEPGIYLTGIGGVRIEDLVVLTNDGVKVLTKTSREIIYL